MNNEIWKKIPGYEGLYEVSNLGHVRSLNYNHTGKTKVLKPANNWRGYLIVNLYKNGKHKLFRVHRLVAEAFIPNPMNKPAVNHKNEVKTDNFVSNLEWMTAKENNNYGTHNERISKPVLQYTKDGKLVSEYPSSQEASRQTGIYQSNISRCCSGKYKSAGGFIWMYV